MNTANRSFRLVVATAAAPYAVLVAASCGFGMYLADRVGEDGVGALGRGVLLPATAMLVLLGLGAVAGIASVARQLSATRRLSGHVERHRAVAPVTAPDGVEVIDHEEPFAFTFGLVRPRVAVSRGLIERLAPEELDAVVLHERYHVGARDPLKLFIAQAAARTCFFLPAIGHLVARYLAGRELAADRHALRDSGRSALAGALFKVVGGPEWSELDAAAAMAGPHLLEVRVDQLEHGTEPALAPLPTASVVASAVVLGALGATVAAVAVHGGVSMMQSTSAGGLSTGDLLGTVAGGLACTGGWVWLATAASRRLRPPELTTTDA